MSKRRILVVGEGAAAEREAEALARPDREVRAWSLESDGPDAAGSSAGLARALVAFEREVDRDPADAVLLADDSDAALAAALVALKRPIEVEAAARVSAGAGVNARLIFQLTET